MTILDGIRAAIVLVLMVSLAVRSRRGEPATAGDVAAGVALTVLLLQ